MLWVIIGYGAVRFVLTRVRDVSSGVKYIHRQQLTTEVQPTQSFLPPLTSERAQMNPSLIHIL